MTRDRTVSIDGRLYEAPTKLIGEQVSLLFHEHRPDRVEILFKGRSHGMLMPLDKKINTTAKRDRPIQGKLFGEVSS